MCSLKRSFATVTVLFSTLTIVMPFSAASPPSIAAHAQPQQEQPPKRTLAQRSTAKIIDTPDPNVKWRISGGNFVERTTDGGATWHGQQVNAHDELLAGSAPSAKVCWVVGREGAVYVTKDALKWRKTSAPTSAELTAVSAQSAQSAIVTAADGREYETHDGGKKWKQVRQPR
jgi:photosystem II stability/assembly factor-like uncharacterized protein